MSEYIVDFGETSSAFVRLAMAEVRAHVAELCEPIVHCKDCEQYSIDRYGKTWCDAFTHYVEPDGFCAWGEPRGDWVTCKCGEEIEAPSGWVVCPSCGRRWMNER